MTVEQPIPIKRIFLLMLFIAFTCIFASDMHIPSLPAINHSLQTSESLTQLTVTLFFLGICIGQLLVGPFSDRFGRRPVLIIGLSISIIGSLVCAIAANIETLLLGRFIQGLGAAGGFGLVRSACTDLYRGNRLAQVSSYLWMVIALAPALAPIAGGYVQTYFDWHVNFRIQSVIFCVAILLTFFLLPETNRHLNPMATKISHIRITIWALLKHPSFMLYVFCSGITLSGTMSYFAVSAYLYQETLLLSPSQNGWLAVGVTAGMIMGNFLNTSLLNHYPMNFLMKIGFCLMFGSGLFMVICAGFGLISIALLLGPMIIYIIGSNFIYTNAGASALTDRQGHAGLANSLFSCIQMVITFVGGSFAAYMPSQNQLPLGLMLTSIGITGICVMTFVVSKREMCK